MKYLLVPVVVTLAVLYAVEFAHLFMSGYTMLYMIWLIGGISVEILALMKWYGK